MRRWFSAMPWMACAIALWTRAGAAQTPPPPAAPAAPALVVTTADSARLLLAAATPAEQRLSAAVQLCNDRSPTSRDAIIRALQSGQSEIAAAAAHALSDANWRDADLMAPLQGLLGRNTSINLWVCRAIVPFSDNPALLQALQVRAVDLALGTAPREPIVQTIGYFVSKTAAASLMDILSNPSDAPLSHSAAVGLTNLSGQTSIGDDPVQWQNWWAQHRGLTDAAFVADVARQRLSTYNALIGENRRLESETSRLLKSAYAASPSKAAMLDSYLNSDAPQVREVGIELAEVDIQEGRGLQPQTRDRLLAMIQQDPAASLRVSAASALALDPANASAMIDLLQQENDPVLQAALLNAVAARQDLRVLRQAIGLLGQNNPSLVRAAAGAIAQAGETLRAPVHHDMAQQASATLLRTLKSSTGQTPPVRVSLLDAMASLRDPRLYDQFAQLQQSEAEPEAVRSAAIGGIGQLALADNAYLDSLLSILNSPNATDALRARAVAELAKTHETKYDVGLVDLLYRNPPPSSELSRELWQTLQSWLPFMEDGPIEALANQFKDHGDAPREVAVRRFYVNKLDAQAPSATDDRAASQHQTIGQIELDGLKQPIDAAADYAKAVDWYLKVGLPVPPEAARREAEALIAAGPPFDPAIKYVTDALANPKLIPPSSDVVRFILEQFPVSADQLAKNSADRASLAKAIALADAFRGANLNLGALRLGYINDAINEASVLARRNLDSLNSINP